MRSRNYSCWNYIKKTVPLQLEVFILSNSRRIMNKIVPAIDGFKDETKQFTDMDSTYTDIFLAKPGTKKL